VEAREEKLEKRTRQPVTTAIMASLPPALDFPKTEEEICTKWAEEQTFKNQDELALERGDEVRW